LLLCCLVCLSAQSRRSAYQQAFRTWRQTEPTLEADAATAGTTLAPKANRVATLAAGYGAERMGYLRAASEDVTQRVLGLRNAAARPVQDPAPAAEMQQIVSNESQVVGTFITSFANDPDRGIQQLRQALERERAALTALNSAIADRQKAQAKTAQSSTALERARTKAGDEYGKLAFGLAQSAAQIEKETSTWASYYQRLATGVAGPEVSSAPAVVTPVSPPAAAPPAAPVVAPPAAPRPSGSVPSPPGSLARYVGGWTFPPAGGQFHGSQPEFIDLVVHEDRGRVTGTLYGRFKLPPGSTGDPVLRFDFEGVWQSIPTQTFNLVTGDGAKGTIDLIPGPAFNLIEVNFQTEPKPNKVRLGNFILLKK